MTAPALHKYAEGDRVCGYAAGLDEQTGAHVTGQVWSHGPKDGTRWVIPDNPAYGSVHYSGCIMLHVSGMSIEAECILCGDPVLV